MTPDDVIAELGPLGPWELRGKTHAVRNAAGLCPLAAAVKARGKPWGSAKNVFGHETLGRAVGMSQADAEDLADAADGTGHLTRDDGRERDRVAGLRARLLAACGLVEVRLVA